MDVYGYVRIHISMLGVHISKYGYIWVCMGIYGYVWVYMDMYRYGWVYMGSIGTIYLA